MPGIIPPGPGIGQALQGYQPPAPQPAAVPPDVFRGYSDLRQSVAHHLNRHLYRAATLDAATLRVLARKRTVSR